MAATAMEQSSSISFTSSHLSNPPPTVTNHQSAANLEAASLIKLSSNLEQLLTNSDCDYTDAEIIVEEEAHPVGVHRCVLAARSKFFLELFKKDKESSAKSEKKPRYHMKDLLKYGSVRREAFLHLLNYIYTGRLKPSPFEVSTCVDTVCAHDSCKPAIDFAVELMYASYAFQIPELVSSFQRRLCNYVEKSLVENVLPILLAAFHCDLRQLLDQCIERVARSDLDRFCIQKELPVEISEKIKQLRAKSANSITEEADKSLERTEKVLKALDSDDIELVKLLLTESDITLDQANGLHYAVAYSDPKVVAEVLALDMADVNFRNSRGYTVLHFAAMRREPLIIISLIGKGANASDLTFDGRSAINICRRLTRPKDYYTKTAKGQEANKDRLCIDLLEREIRRNPLASGDTPSCSHSMPEDLQMRLLYLEKRVGLAQLFFPTEANVAMDVAHVEGTSEFTGVLVPPPSNGATGNLTQVDLNETPYMQTKRLLARMEALMKTVETGRRYFPSCSQVLDKYMDEYMDEDIPDMSHPERGSVKERRLKRMRYNELKNDVKKAYSKDKEAKIARSCLSASSPASSSLREALENPT